MKSSSIIAGKEDGTLLGLEGTMKSLEVNAKFDPDSPQLYLSIFLDGFLVRGKLPVLSLRSLSIDSKVILNNSQIKLVSRTIIKHFYFHSWKRTPFT